MNWFRTLFAEAWRQLLLGLALLSALGALMFWRINKSPSGFGAEELSTRQNSFSWHAIWHNPINAPFKIVERLTFLAAHTHSLNTIRIAPTLFGIGTVILFFIILRFWFDTKIAILGSGLFASSGWFLSFARIGAPDILCMGVLLLLACSLWIKHGLHRNPIVLFTALMVAGSLYIPGLFWYLIIGILWRRQSIRRELVHTKMWIRVLAIVIFLAALIPLGFTITHQPNNLWTVLGMPQYVPTFATIWHNFSGSIRSLFYFAPFNPLHTVGHQPVFSVFTDVIFVLGLYQLWLHRWLDRSRMLAGASLIGFVLVSFGVVSIALLLPILFIIVTLGIVYLLDIWFEVFPNNPVARTVGLVMLTLAVGFACAYQLRLYFVAWPNDPATKIVFSHKDLIS